MCYKQTQPICQISLVMVGCELEPSNPEVCINLHMEYILIMFLKLKVTIAKKRNEK